MVTLSQRIKGAVKSAPFLLKKLYTQGGNQAMFNTIVTRLLPFRASVEIEHFPVEVSSGLSKYANLRDKEAFYSFDVDSGKIEESKISIFNWKDLVNMYDLLDILKTNTFLDTEGSIHIHTDISKWLTSGDIANKAATLQLMQYSNNPEIMMFIEKMLYRTGEIFNYDVSQIPFDLKRGYCLASIEKEQQGYDNRRTLQIHLTSQYNNAADHILGNLNISDNSLYRYRQYRIDHFGIPPPGMKRNWINVRTEMGSIEYRVGECSFDYETIVGYMIKCTQLTKEFLKFVDYVSKEAMKDPKAFFFRENKNNS